MNKLDDGAIQGEYMFSEIGVSNHWENLFLDKSDWVSSISDPTIERYVQGDNYSQLHTSLTAQNWTGFIPDLEGYERGAEAFSADGFAGMAVVGSLSITSRSPVHSGPQMVLPMTW